MQPVAESVTDDLQQRVSGAGSGDLFQDDDSFKVAIRIRPPLHRELHSYRPFQNTTVTGENCKSITISEDMEGFQRSQNMDGLMCQTHRFTFDHVFAQTATQADVYDKSAKPVVLSCLQGYNGALIAYGQTGTGKTYTMEGDANGTAPGIIPRAIEEIFSYIPNDKTQGCKYLVRISYLQIYNEVISDLLKPDKHDLIIREDKKRGVYCHGLSEWVVRTPGEVYGLMAHGAQQRATGATKLNEISSRSHAVCIIIVEKSTLVPNEHNNSDQLSQGYIATGLPRSQDKYLIPEARYSIKVGKLNLVDLAGSERVHVTGATGKRLEESKKINQSLSALGNVIAALTANKARAHIPYRDSKLTRILEDSIGGNCKTTMLCMTSPSLDAFQESLSTLKFANRAKSIKNSAYINEDGDQRTLLRKYERELRKLRAELHKRNQELVDKRQLLEIEAQKRKAEADKVAAITALEAQSRNFIAEKTAKKQLEQKILSMQSQLLIGGHQLQAMPPAFRNILAKEQSRIRQKYEDRLRELEKEREVAEEDRAQADRYKQLLLKQRDIMIALTARLNERDEQILQLQEELEAYDKYQRQLEDSLDARTQELFSLRKKTMVEEEDSEGSSSQTNRHQTDKQLDKDDTNGPSRTPSEAASTPRMSDSRQSSPTRLAENLFSVLEQRQQEQRVLQLQSQIQSVEMAREREVQRLQGELQKSKAQCEQLQAVNEELRVQARQGSEESISGKSNNIVNNMDQESWQSVRKLQVQADSHVRERTALKTILQDKIQTLVQEAHKGVISLNENNDQKSMDHVMSTVSALHNLVDMTIIAMGQLETNNTSAQ